MGQRDLRRLLITGDAQGELSPFVDLTATGPKGGQQSGM